MRSFSERLRGLDALMDRYLWRHPRVTGTLASYGVLLLFGLAAAVFVGSGAAFGGTVHGIVYSTQDGDVVSLQPESGETVTVYGGDGYATAPSEGARTLSFSVLRGEGDSLRGDLYRVNLVQQTLARLISARPGEAFVFPEFSQGRGRIAATHYAEGSPPNVLISFAGGVSSQLLQPQLPESPALQAPEWLSGTAVYAWRTDGERISLVAHDFLERQQAEVYEPEGEVDALSYFSQWNALLFAERPRDSGLAGSQIKVRAGNSELPVSGAGGLGLYDPSPGGASLEGEIALLWTDPGTGEAGLGTLDPDGWTFEKTGVEVEPGSRNPRVSPDGLYLAVTDGSGSEISVHSMEDSSLLRRIDDVQPPGEALDRLREAGMEVPEGSERRSPAGFSWSSFEGS